MSDKKEILQKHTGGGSRTSLAVHFARAKRMVAEQKDKTDGLFFYRDGRTGVCRTPLSVLVEEVKYDFLRREVMKDN